MLLKCGIFLLILLGTNGDLSRNGVCNIPDSAEWDMAELIFQVKDNEFNAEKVYSIENIIALTMSTETYVKYDLNIEESKLKFSLTEEFKNYVQNENEKTHTINLEFGCSDNSKKKMDLNLIVETIVPYKPEFVNAPFEYELALPILPNKDLLEVNISATDQNIGDEQLVFSFESDCNQYFEFSKVSNDRKTYSSHLKTKKLFDQGLVCPIAVTDKTKLSAKTTITFKKDIENSQVPNPIFEQPLYEAILKEDTIEHADIKLQNTDYDPTFNIISDYRDYFKFENKSLTLVKPLPEDAFDGRNYISIIIEARYPKNNSPGQTVVLLTSTSDSGNLNVPIFEEPLYLAQYIDSLTIQHDPIKLTTKIDEDNIQISSDFPNHFTFKNNKLTLKKELTEEDFKDNSYIIVKLQATFGKNSGKTAIIINSPKKSTVPNPIFKESLYIVEYVNENEIKSPDINLISSDYIAEFKIHSESEQYFDFIDNKLKLKTALPEKEFDNKRYISIELEATYKGALNSGKTAIIINSPKKSSIIPIFESPLYIGDYKDEKTIEHSNIKLLVPTNLEVKFEIQSDYKNHFNFENEKLIVVEPLPKEVFLDKNFITVILVAIYGSNSGNTILVINSPEKTNDPIPVFEEPYYLARYVDEKTIEVPEVKLKSDKYEAKFTVISSHSNYFDFIDNKLVLIQNLPKEEFEDENFILIVIKAEIKEALISGKTVIILQKSSDSEPTKSIVKYPKKVAVFDIDPDFEGSIGTFTARSSITEEIIYDIKKTDIFGQLEYSNSGKLKVIEKLVGGNYHQITLSASGVKSKSEDTMDIILILNERINGESSFDYSLIVEHVEENSTDKKIFSAPTNTDLNILKIPNKWFYIKDNSLMLKTVDREDEEFKNMITAQVNTKIRATKITSTKNFYNRTIRSYFSDTKNNEATCVDISTIPAEQDVLNVVVIIDDVNDHPPKFKESYMVIGYPQEELLMFIAPPYLVKVTATDADTGINAKIKYSVNKNFLIDSEYGTVFPGENLEETLFTVTATDQNGAGLSTTIDIRVKMLKEDEIIIMNLNNVAYSEIDNFLLNLGEKTQMIIRYLTYTALPKTKDKSKHSDFSDNNFPKIRVIAYALKKNSDDVLTTKEFKKLIDDLHIEVDLLVESYSSQYSKEEEDDDSGWIAAVSSLAVLLILVLVGVILGYICYIRPKMVQNSNNNYVKNMNRESIHVPPVETKIESSLAERRPTGFPVGFSPTDLEDEANDTEEKDVDDNDEDSVEYEKNPEDFEERRKSTVTFDVNVTEIEIEKL